MERKAGECESISSKWKQVGRKTQNSGLPAVMHLEAVPASLGEEPQQSASFACWRRGMPAGKEKRRETLGLSGRRIGRQAGGGGTAESAKESCF